MMRGTLIRRSNIHMAEQLQENKMGTLPVNKLLISMSLPMMISMLIQALYNVVDSVFVAQINENALTAVGMAFPFQNLMISVGVGTGVGVNALLSRSLGEKKFDVANKSAENGVFLAILSYLAFLVAGVLLSRPFFAIQTDIAEIVEYGTTYLTICLVLSVGIFIEIMFERLLQSTGRTLCTMFTQGLGAITNIILDPCLIFGLGPFPELGVAGAAWATVIGQMAAAVLAIILNQAVNREIHLSVRDFRPDGHIIKTIYSVGVPSIIMSSISSVMTFGMNIILMGFTSTATAVFNVYFKLQSFVFMPIFGLNNGLVPIVAYNYGARKGERLVKAVKLACCYAVGIMVIGLVIVQLFPGPILLLFNASDYMLEIGVPALRTISISFLFAGFCVISSSAFQALGHGVLSMIMSFVRQLIVLLPVAWLFSLTGNLGLVWFSYPIAEIAAVLVSILFLRRIYVQVVQPLMGTPSDSPAAP